MQCSEHEALENRKREAFRVFLRTGTRVEFKFNPYHDPRDGRFTFSSEGSSGTSGHATNRREPQTNFEKARPFNDPANPRNHSLHRVESGDTLTRIAGLRKGLTASDLAWLNGIAENARLRIGQTIKLPHQAFLDRGRDARNKFLALSLYMETHNRRLPPDPLHAPSVKEQLVGPAIWHDTPKNGYVFAKDPISRTRRAHGELSFAETPTRSKTNQRAAGGSDRRRADDGGHYIAVDFNGPTDKFNHFAQDAGFNRGTYRALEDSWARDMRKGKHVSVDITPIYQEASQRPDSLHVEWSVNGHLQQRNFANHSKGKAHGGR